ncbi:MAG: hypothetical protein WCB27_07440 [Thermoguttaceae bacterium]
MLYARRRITVLLPLLALAGCTSLPEGKSPLLPTQMSANSVALDMFFVRFPFADPAVNEKLWEQIDEQQFAPDLRERLAQNGFRVGVVSGQLPVQLSKLMELSDKPPPTGRVEGVALSNLEAQPRVMHRHVQTRAGQPAEILASSIYPELTVLLHRSDQLSGETYHSAQGVFTAKAIPQPDGRTRLQLVPELQHDQPKQRWDLDNQGVLRFESSRPKEVYDDMTIAADLRCGAMLIVSSLPNRPGSLGYYFLTSNDGRLEQRLLIVRLSQIQHDGLFLTPEQVKSEEQKPARNTNSR